MERRTLLAIILSLFFLLAYNSLIYHPAKKSYAPVNIPQDIVNKRDMTTERKDATQNLLQKSTELPIKTPPPTDETKTIDTQYFTTEATNIGGALKSVVIKKYSHKLPIKAILQLSGYENARFTLEKADDNLISYSYTDGTYKIVKDYDFSDKSGIIRSDLSITNISNMSKLENFKIVNLSIDTANLDEKMTPLNERSLFEYSVSQDGSIYRKGNAMTFTPKERLSKQAAIKWAAFRDRYFCVIVKPEFKTVSYSTEPIDRNNLTVNTKS